MSDRSQYTKQISLQGGEEVILFGDYKNTLIKNNNNHVH